MRPPCARVPALCVCRHTAPRLLLQGCNQLSCICICAPCARSPRRSHGAPAPCTYCSLPAVRVQHGQGAVSSAPALAGRLVCPALRMCAPGPPGPRKSYSRRHAHSSWAGHGYSTRGEPAPGLWSTVASVWCHQHQCSRRESPEAQLTSSSGSSGCACTPVAWHTLRPCGLDRGSGARCVTPCVPCALWGQSWGALLNRALLPYHILLGWGPLRWAACAPAPWRKLRLWQAGRQAHSTLCATPWERVHLRAHAGQAPAHQLAAQGQTQ